MMPLPLANIGEEYLIRKVGGSPEVKKHLEDLGFVAGGTATLITVLNGNVIVKVKEARVAISEEMAYDDLFHGIIESIVYPRDKVYSDKSFL